MIDGGADDIMKKVLTIAGSDCSGGAGIQADLKTMGAHKVYGMSVITALTAQNTTGVYGIEEALPEFVAKQIDCVFTDIRPDAVKVGMVSNSEIIKIIADKLRKYDAQNVVVDPVMVSTSGSRLLDEDASSALKLFLLPVADLITPNIPEAEVLCGFEINDRDDMERAAKIISSEIKTSVLVKGGHCETTADDVLCSALGEVSWFDCRRVDNSNTHGTGCTLSSAIACRLAEGFCMEESIRKAKEYVTGALEAGLDLGSGSGPLNHFYKL